MLETVKKVTLASAVFLSACGQTRHEICTRDTSVYGQAQELKTLAEGMRYLPDGDTSILAFTRRCRRESFDLAISQLNRHSSLPEHASIQDLNRHLTELQEANKMSRMLGFARDTFYPPTGGSVPQESEGPET